MPGGSTGHAEAMQFSFGAKQIGYAEPLHFYISVAHDPTQPNRQHPDVGVYREKPVLVDRSPAGTSRAYFSALKRMRCGRAPSSPRRFFLSASYSW